MYSLKKLYHTIFSKAQVMPTKHSSRISQNFLKITLGIKYDHVKLAKGLERRRGKLYRRAITVSVKVT